MFLESVFVVNRTSAFRRTSTSIVDNAFSYTSIVACWCCRMYSVKIYNTYFPICKQNLNLMI